MSCKQRGRILGTGDLYARLDGDLGPVDSVPGRRVLKENDREEQVCQTETTDQHDERKVDPHKRRGDDHQLVHALRPVVERCPLGEHDEGEAYRVERGHAVVWVGSEEFARGALCQVVLCARIVGLVASYLSVEWRLHAGFDTFDEARQCAAIVQRAFE